MSGAFPTIPSQNRRATGFTLIELLIVVAIIAVLAAIAVPNFLAAHTRSKVVKVISDHRTIAMALESYFLDNNSYVNDSDNTLGLGGQNGLARLTTPLPYMVMLPVDPFQTNRDPLDYRTTLHYELGSGADHRGWGNVYPAQGADKRVQSWLILSAGADGGSILEEDDTSGNDQWPWGTVCLTYDPTNGTVSNGDIYRAGGAVKIGRYWVDGVFLGKIPGF